MRSKKKRNGFAAGLSIVLALLLAGCPTPSTDVPTSPDAAYSETDGAQAQTDGASQEEVDPADTGDVPDEFGPDKVAEAVKGATRTRDEHFALLADDPREPKAVPSEETYKQRLANDSDLEPLQKALSNAGLSSDQASQMVWLAAHRNSGQKLDRVHQRHKQFQEPMRQAIDDFGSRMQEAEAQQGVRVSREALLDQGIPYFVGPLNPGQ